MKINEKDLPPSLVKYIKNPDSLEGEDIIIQDSAGNTIGVIIQPKAYDFFLRKIKEKENELDSKPSENYDENSKSLKNLMEDYDNEK